MPNDYGSTLDWLRNLIGSAQTMYGQQFQTGLGAEQQALASRLAEQGRETDAQLALQKVIADWQNQLATKKQQQEEQAQQFSEEQARLQTSPAYMATVGNMQNFYSPQGQNNLTSFISNYLNRVTPGWNATNYFTPASGTSGVPAVFTRTRSSGLPF